MKRNIFTIGMGLLLMLVPVPVVGGAVLAAENDKVNLRTTIPAVVGIDFAPGLINFGIVSPGGSSPASEADRTITIANTGNCDVWIVTDILGEELTAVSEKLGHGDGTTTVFGPTDYTPVSEATVYLDDVKQTAGVIINVDTGTVTFNVAPESGVLVTIDYTSASTLYSEYVMLYDPAAPPETKMASYARELCDDCTATMVADIYPPVNYPAGVKTAQIVFYATVIQPHSVS